MKLIDALESLDPQNDAHWTSDGSPRLDVISSIVGHAVSRADVSAGPRFTRKTAMAQASEPKAKLPYDPFTDSEAKVAEVIEKPKEDSSFDLDTDIAELLSLTAADFMADRDLFPQKIAAMELAAGRLSERIRHAQRQMQTLYQRAADLKEFERNTATREESDTGQYLKRQHEIRMERAMRRKRFIESAGTTAADVRSGLEVEAPIDKAYIASGKKNPAGRRPSNAPRQTG